MPGIGYFFLTENQHTDRRGRGGGRSGNPDALPGISKRGGKVPHLDFSTERRLPPSSSPTHSAIEPQERRYSPQRTPQAEDCRNFTPPFGKCLGLCGGAGEGALLKHNGRRATNAGRLLFLLSVVGNLRANPRKLRIVGEMAEWLMSPVLKTGIPARLSRVRISLSAIPCPALRVNAQRSRASLPCPLWGAPT